MLHVVLYQPEIPPNTGNVIRLCANSGARLHLIRPLGFDLDHAKLRRAGLDYHEFADVAVHDDLDAFSTDVKPHRLFALSTRGRHAYTDIRFDENDAVVFGPETRGLPQTLLDALPPNNACDCRCGRTIAASIFPMRLPSSFTKRGGKWVSPAAHKRKAARGGLSSDEATFLLNCERHVVEDERGLQR